MCAVPDSDFLFDKCNYMPLVIPYHCQVVLKINPKIMLAKVVFGRAILEISPIVNTLEGTITNDDRVNRRVLPYGKR